MFGEMANTSLQPIAATRLEHVKQMTPWSSSAWRPLGGRASSSVVTSETRLSRKMMEETLYRVRGTKSDRDR
jgi:hypothetical protein